MQIIPIAGGKGGVGKSLLAANLAIALAEAGKKVILVDMDLGASNLHLILGIAAPKQGIATLLSKKTPFVDALLPTHEANLRFLAGDAEIPGVASLKAYEKNFLIKNLLKLKTDYLILDLGAGTHLNILDFFLLSKRGIIITTPSITATVNAYLFLKNAVFRMLYSSYKRKSPGAEYLDNLKNDVKLMQRLYFQELVPALQKIDPENTEVFLTRVRGFNPRIVMNMIDNPADAENVEKVQRSCKEYLGINLEHLGVVYRDSVQDIALASRLPIIRYKPQSMIAQSVYRIAEKIIQAENIDEHPLIDSYTEFFDESFQSAEQEALLDFNSRMDYIEDLLGVGGLTYGDLAEMIKAQHYEISVLKKENLLLKTRLKKFLE